MVHCAAAAAVHFAASSSRLLQRCGGRDPAVHLAVRPAEAAAAPCNSMGSHCRGHWGGRLGLSPPSSFLEQQAAPAVHFAAPAVHFAASPSSFLQRCGGRDPGIHLAVHLVAAAVHFAAAHPTSCSAPAVGTVQSDLAVRSSAAASCSNSGGTFRGGAMDRFHLYLWQEQQSGGTCGGAIGIDIILPPGALLQRGPSNRIQRYILQEQHQQRYILEQLILPPAALMLRGLFETEPPASSARWLSKFLQSTRGRRICH
eukprot:jgi/Botrbrau1/23281/Bobra.0102s0024.1